LWVTQTIPEAEAYCPPGQSETNAGCIDLPANPVILSGSLKFVFSGTYNDGTFEEKTCTVNERLPEKTQELKNAVFLRLYIQKS
jgi:hypothetical protein